MSDNCTLLISYDTNTIRENEITEKLDSKSEDTKITGLKLLIQSIVNGEQHPRLLMTVIKSCLNCQSNVMKKLLLIYWEIVKKKNSMYNIDIWYISVSILHILLFWL